MSEPHLTLRLKESDDVAVARADILPDTPLPSERVTTRERIPRGHKVALRGIAANEPVRKYGQIIGVARQAIEPGEHVHVHNMAMADFERDYAYCADATPTAFVPEAERATFEGYRRANGGAGTRNYLGVLTSVNCSATVAKAIAARFTPELLAAYPNVDGVVALTHGTGCGMADSGEGFANLQRVLWGYAGHPNFAGILLVGLGCEVNQIPFLLDAYNLQPGPLFQTMTIQEIGGTRRTIEAGVERLKGMLPQANEAKRTTIPASELAVALQCGGSDAYSGITANPALGAAVDLLVRHGGTGVLGETPEIYGAEHLLTRRAENREVGESLIERIRWWEEYTERNGAQLNNNPSPGNKAGGLTTILEKSLGAAAKGGTTNLVDVLRYAERLRKRGFVFMDTPGYDPASVTGQIAGGCQLVCFTTGRGSVSGFKPAPTLKLATNTPMYRSMDEDMDLNCGEIADGDCSVQEMGERLFRLFLDTASGKRSKSEEFDFGDNEFVPWQIGATV
ncbi:UxaA family hydrolase [Aquibaculum arenosum]|uniref:Altronate dehydratase family protein n=1 Tax=Aquibaculum arenosum TaxID=3032591 RepID=A0ABT5YHM9_9PROT|nr:altronate dehydratase family protein [Fodinicurvata sp. CAU 1616]MDF2094418.1 altronate dehydratase family protein [Fodinicurvata sp. CAU 1616]